ncbi:MAG TPA: ABC transporter substrate-binding protein [Candidatus Limnocylindrales bacterium]|nr:ABC transporter substrate-binding protein [Candidatus Limnocylindrales bacterium]
MRPFRSVPLVVVAILAAACSGAPASPSAASPTTAASPSVAASASAAASPSESASAGASASPSGLTADCQAANLKTVAAGKLTIGTDNPAYPPYYQPPSSGNPPKPWELGDPTNGQGFESAFAYALAQKLGFSKDQVTWIVVPFDNSYAPGPKKFDIDVNQVSYTVERAKQVDMSDGYYTLSQSVVALKANPIVNAKSVADLKQYRFGAQVGTTSLETINNVIAPSTAAKVYNTNDAAIAALKARQIDGLVVDLPTAFYVTAAQVQNSVIVGQFEAPTGADAEHFSAVLAKGSSLTSCVNQAIALMKSDGTLDQVTKEWLSDKANAPVFAP